MKSLVVKSLLIISVVTLTSWLAFAENFTQDTPVDMSDLNMSGGVASQGAVALKTAQTDSTGTICTTCALNGGGSGSLEKIHIQDKTTAPARSASDKSGTSGSSSGQSGNL